MLTSLELLISILGAWIVAGGIYSFLKVKKRKSIPKGAVFIEKDISINTNKKPGNIWLHFGMIIGLGSTTFFLLLTVILCTFNLWEIYSSFIAINFPVWLNWIGIIGLWICYAWGTLVMLYNTNYTPLYKPMKGKYLLATGGPYKYVRHPYYTGNAFEMVFIFFSTGIWLSFIGFFAILSMPFQAKKEEEMLVELFGKRYLDYMKRTGRFFPKLRK